MGNNAAVNYIDAGIKPDILAPGVDIKIRKQTAYETDIVSVTGTSYAVSFVTGGAALLMQWGIVMGNDRYMYGEKLKAYLRRGARPLGIETVSYTHLTLPTTSRV